MTRPPLIMLAPYGPQVWDDLRDALGAVADTTIIDVGDEETMGAMARRVLSLAPRRFHIAGLCMGGYLAFETHRLAPERVAGLALINTSAAPDTTAQSQMRTERIDKLEAKSRQMTFPDQAYIDHAAPWLVAPQSAASSEIMARVRCLLADVPISRSILQQRAMLARTDSRPHLERIQTPVLAVGGTQDRVCPAACTREIGRLVARAETHLLDDCGHLAPVEQPKKLADLMTRWISASGDNKTNTVQEKEMSWL